MIYRARKACTDVGGRYFDKDEEADLNPLLPHSELLMPADPAAAAKLKAAAVEAEAKTKAEAENKVEAEAKTKAEAKNKVEAEARIKNNNS